MVSEEHLTTVQVAEKLGITRVRVWQLIQEDALKAEKFGRDWIIRNKDLAIYQEQHSG